MNDLFKNYRKFVNGVTSPASKDTNDLMARILELEVQGINVAKMNTACVGCAGEGGEIIDLWKKILHHGKPWNDENKQKMIDECGDMFWYLSHLMEVLDVDVEEVLERNVEKLKSRYPGGEFSIHAAENRNETK